MTATTTPTRTRLRALATTLLAATLAVATAVTAARPAYAFCGFYVSGSGVGLVNRATRVALMREGTRTVLSMSNDYEGPPQDFAMVVPVPVVLQQANVRTLPMNVFEHLESVTAPRLVEYWEQDPCFVPPPADAPVTTATGSTYGGSAGGLRGRALGVRIEARFTVGEYNVVVLSATQSSGLETWLHLNHYNIPAGAAAYLAPYVRDQWKFFVARVDIARVQRRPDGSARLSPLRFHYDSPDFRLPVRLGLLNAPAQQDLLVYIIHPTSRFEVANYTNVFIPTNLDVTEPVRASFPTFYAELFDRTLAAAGGRAVVTEYSWGTGSCDPCPSPPLDGSELATLGADVMPSTGASYHGNVMNVTRLHARYDRATLTQDLVFREAPAVVGGRENITNANGGIEQGAVTAPYGQNQFQARYAIRHAWTGPIACAQPRRGVWGGPPNGVAPTATAARDLDRAARTGVDLASVVRTPVASLGLSGAGVRTPQRVIVHKPSALPPVRPGLLGLVGLASGAAVLGFARARRRK